MKGAEIYETIQLTAEVEEEMVEKLVKAEGTKDTIIMISIGEANRMVLICRKLLEMIKETEYKAGG